jgi:hypothetical protein
MRLPLVNNAALTGDAVFRGNTIESTAALMIDSNSALSLAQNRYRYYGLGNPAWRYAARMFPNLRDLQNATRQDVGSTEMPLALRLWPALQVKPAGIWKLNCSLPVSLDSYGLIGDETLRQIVILKSQATQYFSRRLEVTLNLTISDPHLFNTSAFRNAVLDLDLGPITVTQSATSEPEQTTLLDPTGKAIAHWDGFASPAALGAALRESLGEPFFSQMDTVSDDQ